MMNRMMHTAGLGVWLLSGGMCLAQDVPDTYYKTPKLFSTAPNVQDALQSIDRFGPVGIGIELMLPPFQMRIKNVEKGSPAEATGKLKQGQLIDSINGKVLQDIDPRIILGGIIAQAEATDGVVTLRVRDKKGQEPYDVVVKIPVLGAYGETWPMRDEKSDKIVRGLAEYLKTSGADGMGLGMLFLLSTGDESDLAFVRDRLHKCAEEEKKQTETSAYPWHAGYGGPALCEYVLRTGDKTIMHSIQLLVDRMEETFYNGAWGHRGIGNYGYMSGGHMNAAGVHALTFMLLAKECGANVNEDILNEAVTHFYRFAGRGNVAYGDGTPEQGFVDNGKTGGLAFAMKAADSLMAGSDTSIYARASEISALKSFYSTSYMLHGHTGGGIGEIWRGAAMGLLAEKRPNHYREFMDNRAWFYDLSRRYDGSFGIVGGERYDDPGSWAIGMGLVYTIPRKTLRMTGAPASEHSQVYKLPEQPWGTDNDNTFCSIEPALTPDGKRLDMNKETLAANSALGFFREADAESTSREWLVLHAHHPDITIRKKAMQQLQARFGDAIVLSLFKSDDPRVRAEAIAAIGSVTDTVVDQLVGMINDPAESLWVVKEALERLADGPNHALGAHVDQLGAWLQHDEWWMRQAALKGLSVLATDKKHYRSVLPMLAALQASNKRAALIWSFGDVAGNLEKADPEIIAFALEQFGQAYANAPQGVLTASGIMVHDSEPTIMRAIAWNMTRIPGGYDKLYHVSKNRYPGQTLPHNELFFDADRDQFSPELQAAMNQTILDEMIPAYIASEKNRKLLLEEVDWKPYKGGFYYREPRMEGLVALYQNAGVHDYDWLDFGPAPDAIAWHYHAFDPTDGKLFGGTRYRDVDYPAGMDNWFAKDFEPEKAGWQKGRAPFGQKDGKLVTTSNPCGFDFCRCGKPMNTFWEKEVLLLHTRMTLPEFKEGYRYRMVIGGMSHVNRGEGYDIYVNGKKMIERNRGVGKREGALPICKWLDKEWITELQKPEVVIAARSFLKHDFKTRTAEQHFSIWFQEMKVPPLDEEVADTSTVRSKTE